MRAIVIVLSVTSSAMAASNRVFVSGSGVDVGTCPITSPCRSFSYAMTQVSPGGEIIALNTAGYGVVTINQSVTIVAAPGATAFVAASSGNAITVTPAQTDVVTLRIVSAEQPAAAVAQQSKPNDPAKEKLAS